MGDLALHDEDLKIEKSFFPLSNFAAFLIKLIFKLDLMCQALLKSKDNGANRFSIKYLYSLFFALNLAWKFKFFFFIFKIDFFFFFL